MRRRGEREDRRAKLSRMQRRRRERTVRSGCDVGWGDSENDGIVGWNSPDHVVDKLFHSNFIA